MQHKKHSVCPIASCQESMPGSYLMCSEHFKMMPRETMKDFFGETSNVAKGISKPEVLREVALRAVEEVAIVCASRKAAARTAISGMIRLFS